MTQQPDPAFWGEVLLNGLPWEPMVDGDSIPAAPFELIQAGAGADVDLLVGSNTDETRLFLVPGDAIDQIPPEALAGSIAAYGLAVEPTLAAYRASHPGASVGDLFSAVQTDWYWRIPALRLAEAHAANATASPTYMYEFAWRSPQFGGRLGAGHSLEIAFVFDTLGHQTGPRTARTRRNRWPTPCTRPGWRSPPPEIPAGRSTISAAGRPCTSTWSRRWWTIPCPGARALGGRAVGPGRRRSVRRSTGRPGTRTPPRHEPGRDHEVLGLARGP